MNRARLVASIAALLASITASLGCAPPPTPPLSCGEQLSRGMLSMRCCTETTGINASGAFVLECCPLLPRGDLRTECPAMTGPDAGDAEAGSDASPDADADTGSDADAEAGSDAASDASVEDSDAARADSGAGVGNFAGAEGMYRSSGSPNCYVQGLSLQTAGAIVVTPIGERATTFALSMDPSVATASGVMISGLGSSDCSLTVAAGPALTLSCTGATMNTCTQMFVRR